MDLVSPHSFINRHPDISKYPGLAKLPFYQCPMDVAVRELKKLQRQKSESNLSLNTKTTMVLNQIEQISMKRNEDLKKISQDYQKERQHKANNAKEILARIASQSKES